MMIKFGVGTLVAILLLVVWEVVHTWRDNAQAQRFNWPGDEE